MVLPPPPPWGGSGWGSIEIVLGVHLSEKNMAAQYSVMQTILELCEYAEWWTGAQLSKRWWEQEGINLTGARLSVMTAEETE